MKMFLLIASILVLVVAMVWVIYVFVPPDYGHTPAKSPATGAASSQSAEHPEPPPKPTTRVAVDAPVAVPAGSWPQFHGGQNTSGLATGTIPDDVKLLWKFPTKGYIRSSPAVAGDRVYVGSSDGVYCVSLKDGKQVWFYATDMTVDSTPLVLDGNVYFGSIDKNLYCLDDDGKLKWKYETNEKVLSSPNWVKAPKSDDKWILVGSYDNNMHCVNAADGKVVWTSQAGYYINGSPSVAGDKVVFGACDRLLHVVSAADGEGDAVGVQDYIPGTAAIAGRHAYVGVAPVFLACIDIKKMEIAWAFEAEGEFYSTPAVGAELLVVGNRDSNVYCIDRATGTQVWKFETKGPVDSSPVIAGGRVVVGSGDGKVYALELATGKKVWAWEAGDTVSSSPALVNGLIIIGCDDGTLYALTAKK